MYMFYLIAALTVSTGVGAFSQFDTLARQRDAADASRIDISVQQQKSISNALRREFQIDPSRFPSISAGHYVKISPNLIEDSLFGGLRNTGASSYYLNDAGEIIAVLNEGPIAPASGNGDQGAGISGRPQFISGILRFLSGTGPQFSPKGSGHIAQLDIPPGNIPDLAESDLDLVSSVKIETIAAIDPGRMMKIGQLDLGALDYASRVAQAPAQEPHQLPDKAGYGEIAKRVEHLAPVK